MNRVLVNVMTASLSVERRCLHRVEGAHKIPRSISLCSLREAESWIGGIRSPLMTGWLLYGKSGRPARRICRYSFSGE
jgi:hypothetical protein